MPVQGRAVAPLALGAAPIVAVQVASGAAAAIAPLAASGAPAVKAAQLALGAPKPVQSSAPASAVTATLPPDYNS